MAELIPVQYRVRVAQKAVLIRWAVYGALALIVAGAGVAYGWTWQRKQGQTLASLQAEYQARRPVIESAGEMKTKWRDLLERRESQARLRDDRTLLALLHHVSAAANDFDCLETVQIDAQKSATGEKDSYFVRVKGVTADTESLAGLMKRLGNGANPPVNVILESSKREAFFDGHVLRFNILCERLQG